MKRAVPIACVLAGLHLVVLLAGFAAPYDPIEQTRALPFAPPTRVHFFDASGGFHLRPFVYAVTPDPNNFDGYIEDTTQRFSLHLMVSGASYALLPGVESRLHVFGVDAPARISLLGTDGFGRDVLSRLLHGGRVSIGAGLVATFCALVIGLAIGTLAGFFGGRVDAALMSAADLFMAIPWLYLLFAVRAALPLQLDTRATFLLLVAVLGVVGWARPARIVRGIVLSARERTYVTAARGFGATWVYLLRRHILPQTFGVVLTQAGLLIPQYILAEVTLSFLGLGVGEPTPSWGAMLGQLQQYSVLTSYWWMFAPAVALVTVAVSYHALTSAVHERLRVVTN
jgi:peptide/nickel transport system permease protein